MSNNHHTPYPVGTELTAANMNIPPGQIDQALSDSLAGLKAFSALLAGSGVKDASALITMNSTTQGFLPPRMSTVNRDAIASPATGLIIWNTTLARLEYYNGTQWAAFGETGGAMTEIIPSTTLSANTGVSITSIPQGYQDLLLRLKIRSARAAVTDNLNVRFNGDSGASSYIWNQSYASSASITNIGDTSDDAVDILCAAANATANRYLDIAFWILNYADPVNRISGWYRGVHAETTFYTTWGAFEWVGGAALNRIDFDVAIGASFSGVYSLYGLGNAIT